MVAIVSSSRPALANRSAPVQTESNHSTDTSFAAFGSLPAGLAQRVSANPRIHHRISLSFSEDRMASSSNSRPWSAPSTIFTPT